MYEQLLKMCANTAGVLNEDDDGFFNRLPTTLQWKDAVGLYPGPAEQLQFN